MTSCSTVSQYTFFFRYQKPCNSRPCSATQSWCCTTKVMLLHILSVTLPPPAATEAYQAFLFIPSLHGRCITLYLVMIWWPSRSDKNELDQTRTNLIRQEQTCWFEYFSVCFDWNQDQTRTNLIRQSLPHLSDKILKSYKITENLYGSGITPSYFPTQEIFGLFPLYRTKG